MKILLITCLFLTNLLYFSSSSNPDDNEFAEFEDFDDEKDQKIPLKASEETPVKETNTLPQTKQSDGDENSDDDDAIVEEDDEFEHLHDNEEFEGLDQKISPKSKSEPESLTIAKIPHHLRTNWDSYYLEMLMLFGLAVYFLNFLAGKTKNSRIAQSWLRSNRSLLENNFSLIGDDGSAKEVTLPGIGEWLKESESVYNLWCSGRVGCEGMLISMKLVKRHDLITSIARLFKPQQDQITIRIDMDQNEMDSFIFLLANKKICSRLQSETNDLNIYCVEKKNSEKYSIPSSFSLVSEIGEATAAFMDRTVVATINSFEKAISYIHVSDQYSGQKQQTDQSETPTTLPLTKKVIIFCFNLDVETKNMDDTIPLLKLVFYCIDKVRRIRLSKEAKSKAEKNRSRVEEKFLKSTHSQRQEAAQSRRDEKRRVERERMMNEEDPEKQRKLEEKENKREAKKRAPKMKMMKVKG